MKYDVNKAFGAEYFDAGKEARPGVYRSYRLEDFPMFGVLAVWIKNLFNPKRILDVGCAKGFLVKAFKDLGIEAWGVDVSEYALSAAPDDVCPYLCKVDLNKDVLPFRDEYFDFVISLTTIECLHNHELAIHETNRVLRHGGGLFLITNYKATKDKFVINAHGRGYWIKYFQSNGFRFTSEGLDTFRKDCLAQYLATSRRNKIRFRIGKLLYQKGGYLGKEIVLLGTKFVSRQFGILLFMKESQ